MNRWSNEEIEILRKYYPIERVEKVRDRLLEKGYRRTIDAIRRKANLLGIRHQYRWSREEVQILLDNITKSIDELCELLPNRSRDSIITKRYRILREKGISIPGITYPNSTDIISNLSRVDGGSIELEEKWDWDSIIRLQSQVSSKRITRDTKIIHTDTPIGVVFIGDLHIGHVGTDYRRLVEDVDLLSRLENVYVFLLGDYCEFTKTIRRSIQEDLLPSNIQFNMLIDVLSRLRDRLLGVLTGTHETFVLRDVGIDVLEKWCRDHNVSYYKHSGIVTLVVGEVSYTICMRHQYRFESSLNSTNAVRRMLELFSDFDIGVIAHTHRGVVHVEDIRGRERWLLRVGTYKILEDCYAEQKGWRVDSSVYMPMVILYPNTRKIIGFRDFRVGIEYLYYLIDKNSRGDRV